MNIHRIEDYSNELSFFEPVVIYTKFPWVRKFSYHPLEGIQNCIWGQMTSAILNYHPDVKEKLYFIDSKGNLVEEIYKRPISTSNSKSVLNYFETTYGIVEFPNVVGDVAGQFSEDFINRVQYIFSTDSEKAEKVIIFQKPKGVIFSDWVREYRRNFKGRNPGTHLLTAGVILAERSH
jgi:hypothetical protein